MTTFSKPAFRDAVLIVGPMGAGKSTIINYVSRADVAEAGRRFEGITFDTRAYDVERMDITVVDTMGFRDGRKSDEQIRAEIVSYIHEHKLRILAVIILVSDSSVRPAKDMVELVVQMELLHPGEMPQRVVLCPRVDSNLDRNDFLEFWKMACQKMRNEKYQDAFKNSKQANGSERAAFFEFKNNTYSFTDDEFKALWQDKPPLEPDWKVDKCTMCGAEGVKQILAETNCSRHILNDVQHDFDFREIISLTRTFHTGRNIHVGEWGGLLQGNCYQGCRHDNSIPGCRWTCCGLPFGIPGCVSETKTTKEKSFCKKCKENNSDPCYKVCAHCKTTDLKTKGCLDFKPSEHKWEKI